MKLLSRAAVAIIAATLFATACRQPAAAPLGFAPARTSSHAEWERQFRRRPTPARIRDLHRFLTSEPHVAGSERDRVLAHFLGDRFRECGLEDVVTTTHEVMLPRPIENAVEIVAPFAWRASLREVPLGAGSDALGPAASIGPAYHAYSASGEVTAPVVFAGRGDPDDYDWLTSRNVEVRGKVVLVRHSMPYSYRGAKVLTAQQRGAAALLIYSDPADDGYGRGTVYPAGPWGPESRIQRGGIAFDFLVPGDPLTPGWPSTPGAKRIRPADARTLPAIVSAPLSSADARVILEALGGPEVPESWRGALPIPYRAGSDSIVLRVRARSDDSIRPIWTVTGMIRGADRADQVVIVGNHRDAWTYGGVDPSSGTAALLELACNLGELSRAGWRPHRSVLFANWDAEEFGLTSSTEWGEEHERWLRKNAVAYVNVDSGVAGTELDLTAVPSLNPLLEEVARAVRDPATGLTLAARARDRRGHQGTIVANRIGGGSDYTVFLNFLGIPVADLSFDGPYGVYHSIYDTHDWVARIGDPEFRYHAALVELWGLTTMRLADADVLPLDYAPYAARVGEFTAEVERTWMTLRGGAPADLTRDIKSAVQELSEAADQFNARRARALMTGGPADRQRLDEDLLSVERALLDTEGLPGRTWFRHTIFAPKFSYAPEVLPGVAEAVADGDANRAAHQVRRLIAALRRAAAALSGTTD